MTEAWLGPEWKPDRAKMVLSVDPLSRNMNVQVDPGQANAWRREPYYGQLKRWAAASVPLERHVLVHVNKTTTVVLPDREVSLGILAPEERIVLLIVNTASRCGFTPQYQGLEALWRRHRAAGLTVLGFPCNQFGAQEPGDAAEIARFCALTYAVSFPVLAKVAVKGADVEPLYDHLTRARPGLLGGVLGIRAIKWNFSKFLVGRDGRVIARFAPTTKPAALEAEIRAALAEAAP